MAQWFAHYGVKGMKWGVRRYQNPDGTLTELGKAVQRVRASAKTKDQVDSIISSMSPSGKAKLLNGDSDYLSIEQGEYVVKRFLINDRIANTPVAFLDFLSAGKDKLGRDNLEVAIGVRGDRQGAGYGSSIAKKGYYWITKHRQDYGTVSWDVDDNPASEALAKKSGFKFKEQRGSMKRYSI